jgi:hypothetical protein
MKSLASILLLSVAVVSAQSLIPPAAPKHYHSVTVVKGATLLKTVPPKPQPHPPGMVLLTWVPDNSVANEITCIEASKDLRNWTLVFSGATNQCWQPITNTWTFWRAYSALTATP